VHRATNKAIEHCKVLGLYQDKLRCVQAYLLMNLTRVHPSRGQTTVGLDVVYVRYASNVWLGYLRVLFPWLDHRYIDKERITSHRPVVKSFRFLAKRNGFECVNHSGQCKFPNQQIWLGSQSASNCPLTSRIFSPLQYLSPVEFWSEAGKLFLTRSLFFPQKRHLKSQHASTKNDATKLPEQTMEDRLHEQTT